MSSASASEPPIPRTCRRRNAKRTRRRKISLQSTLSQSTCALALLDRGEQVVFLVAAAANQAVRQRKRQVSRHSLPPESPPCLAEIGHLHEGPPARLDSKAREPFR